MSWGRNKNCYRPVLNCVHYRRVFVVKKEKTVKVCKCDVYPQIEYFGELGDETIKNDCGEFHKKEKVIKKQILKKSGERK